MPVRDAANKMLAPGLEGTARAFEFPPMPLSFKKSSQTYVGLKRTSFQSWSTISGDTASTDAWVFVEAQGQQRGFVLSGKQTARRIEFAKRTIS